jgi:signal transduction histidine kinase
MSDRPHFEVTSAVIRQLGEQLISDEVTALLELVKNAYDADATYAQVVVETGDNADRGSRGHAEIGEAGRILVTDNGTGMDEADIRLKWLRISVSEKRGLKRRGLVTPKYSRTPQGDKGLGRLSAQRLGSHVKVRSVKEYIGPGYPKIPSKLSPDQVELDVRWDLFGEDIPLDQIPVSLTVKPHNKARQGTRLEITRLRNAEVWESDARETLVTRLTQLISPFAKDRPFRVTLSIAGEIYNFEKIADKIRSVALSTHLLVWTNGKLRIEGQMKLGVFVPETDNEGRASTLHWETVGRDSGEAFWAFLTKGRKLLVPGLKRSEKSNWFLQYSIEIDEKDIAGLEYEEVEQNAQQVDRDSTQDLFQVEQEDAQVRLIDPGPFEGELDQFAYQGVDLSGIAEVFSRDKTYKDYVKQHAGVRIYRDGFGIRPYGLAGQDWLKLQSGQTSGRSFYGLRPDNVIGYVAISARENALLEDKTDREGLIDTAATRNFFRVCAHAANRINGVFSTLRRKYNDYSKIVLGNSISVLSSEQALSRIREASGAQRTPVMLEPLRRIESTVNRLRDHVDSAENVPGNEAENTIELRTLISRVTREIKELEQPLRRSEHHSDIVENAADYLHAEIANLQRQLREFSELAAVGLTVEAFTHNVVDLADRLHRQTNNIRSVIRHRNVVLPELSSYLEYVRGAITELRLQLRRIIPSMRYLREVREPIRMDSFFESVKRHYLGLRHLADEGFGFTLVEPFDDFAIAMNRGRFTQVVDNLLLNSEYWLREGMRRGVVPHPQFFVQSQAPTIRIWDNGLGIDPSIEDTIFDPFVTAKPRTLGRGLGLFITRQLLDSEGCELHLLPDRNQYSRRYIFEINLRGALNAS